MYVPSYREWWNHLVGNLFDHKHESEGPVCDEGRKLNNEDEEGGKERKGDGRIDLHLQ